NVVGIITARAEKFERPQSFSLRQLRCHGAVSLLPGASDPLEEKNQVVLFQLARRSGRSEHFALRSDPELIGMEVDDVVFGHPVAYRIHKVGRHHRGPRGQFRLSRRIKPEHVELLPGIANKNAGTDPKRFYSEYLPGLVHGGRMRDAGSLL